MEEFEKQFARYRSSYKDKAGLLWHNQRSQVFGMFFVQFLAILETFFFLFDVFLFLQDTECRLFPLWNSLLWKLFDGMCFVVFPITTVFLIILFFVPLVVFFLN